MNRRSSLTGGLAAALLLVGCSGGTADDPTSGPRTDPSPTRSTHVVVTPPAPEPGIHLTFLQQRLDEGSDRASLRVENITRRTLHVRRIGLDWPGWGRFTRPSRHVVGAGVTLDLPLRLPAPRCGTDPSGTTASGLVVTGHHRLRRPVDDMGMRFANRLWESACAGRRLARTVSMAYGAPWRAEGTGGAAVWRTSIELDRRQGSDAVRLVGVQGSVLFDLLPTGRRELAPDAATARLPLAIDPGRCDQHARSQASQPFTFRLLWRLGDGGRGEEAQLAAVLEPTAPQRRDLLRFLDRACGDDR